MIRNLAIAGLVSLPIVGMLIYGVVESLDDGKSSSEEVGGVPRIEWQLLRELDLKTGQASSALTKFDGKKIRMPGFVVPLEDNAAKVTEFLLVPNPQACIHVPPPPANQMVLVRMAGGREHKLTWGPVWIEGIFRITTTESQYGKSSFHIVAESTERYTDE